MYAPGRFRFESSVPLTVPALVIGKSAPIGYVTETGRAQSEPGFEPTPASIREAVRFVVELLGEEYERLLAIDERGQQSRTPPPRRHRLIEILRYGEEVAAQFEGPGPFQPISLDGDALAELSATVALLRRWRNHPAFPSLASTLADPIEGQHTVMLLAVASYLVDYGNNGVGIVTEATGERIPDLYVKANLFDRLDVEIKTPLALRGPRRARLELPEAINVVKRQVKEAASSRSGQLDPRGSGILALGGYHLGGLQVLEHAAQEVLRSQTGKEHLAAIVLAEVSYHRFDYVDERGDFITSWLSPQVEVRIANHPRYHRGLTIAESEPPWRTAGGGPPPEVAH